MKKSLSPLVATLMLCISCSGPSHSDQPAASVATSTSAPAAGADSSKSNACPRTGLWAQCSVETRLSQSGFVVRRVADSTRRRAGFNVMPIAYLLGRHRLDVFLYPTADAVARQVDGLDTALAGPKGKPNQWGVGVQPTFVRSANLIAVFLTDNPTQSERLSLALSAGAPQP